MQSQSDKSLHVALTVMLKDGSIVRCPCAKRTAVHVFADSPPITFRFGLWHIMSRNKKTIAASDHPSIRQVSIQLHPNIFCTSMI